MTAYGAATSTVIVVRVEIYLATVVDFAVAIPIAGRADRVLRDADSLTASFAVCTDVIAGSAVVAVSAETRFAAIGGVAIAVAKAHVAGLNHTGPLVTERGSVGDMTDVATGSAIGCRRVEIGFTTICRISVAIDVTRC